MDKHELIETLRSAMRSHKQWVSNALALIEGVPLEKEKVPVNATECAFGRWYYSEGQKLKKINGIKEIEPLHDALHRTYMEIFAILFGEVNEPSFFSKLFGLSQKIAAEKREAAMEKYNLLQDQSEMIIKHLEQLERVITAMGETQLAMYLE
ncbi:CZB domain-containing protein [Candidatus Electronema sp. PJ]|uniref:CZB domain-containing protein n=1 Tax=Candidatus Electronema sp. PJ TaxID=3401572 RepID=UPI003AA7CD29